MKKSDGEMKSQASPAPAASKAKSISKPKAVAKAKATSPAARPAGKAKMSQSDSNVKARKPAPAVKEKIKKPRLIRDSFTMPEEEYAVLGDVKKLCLKAGIEVKKSELLRIGVAHIRQLSLPELKKSIASLMPLKAGRPKKEK